MIFPGSQQYIEILEKDRRTAMINEDALNYFVLCEELGIEPEDEFLYERGMLEHSLMEEDRLIEAENSASPYRIFYDAAIKLNRSFRFDIEGKLRNLEKHFPGQFGPKGKTPAYKKTPLQIGALHEKLLRYSEERIKNH